MPSSLPHSAHSTTPSFSSQTPQSEAEVAAPRWCGAGAADDSPTVMPLRMWPILLLGLWMSASHPLRMQRWRLQAEQKTAEGPSQTPHGGAGGKADEGTAEEEEGGGGGEATDSRRR